MPNLEVLNTPKTEKDAASELRNKFFEALQPVVLIIAEAEANGFEVGFQFGKDAFNRTQVQAIHIMKKY